MEVEDGGYELVKGVVATDNLEVAFKDIDAAFMVGGFPRLAGMERKDLIGKNCAIFESQGEALNTFAKKTVKVLVVANPCNTNCNIFRKCAPTIPKENFAAMTRLDMHRSLWQIAKKYNDKAGAPVVSAAEVKNPIIWGNHSATQYPDVTHATILIDGKETPVFEAMPDEKDFFHGEFIKMIQQRGKAVIEARGSSSAASAASAAAACMRDWWFGTAPGKFVSMGVCSDGNKYGVPEDLIYSFPVTIKDKKWTIVPDLEIDDFSHSMMDKTAIELLEEAELSAAALAEKK